MSAEPIRNPESALGNSTAAVDAANPWPGLSPFTEDQSGLFFGRDEEIRALTRLMERKALTILFGQSGLGKSSLLQAGVFPRLRAASFLPIYIRLDHGERAPSPTEQVKAMVAAEAQRAGTWTKPGSAKPGETLWEFFHHRDDRLVDASGRTIVPVLVFDQFEELFTLGAAAGAQRDRAVAFMSELAELVENRPSEQLVARLEQSADEMDAFDFNRTDYRVCISLREDYLPHLEGLKTIMPALMENRMRLTRMTGTQALDAVLKPGAELVTEEVARAIVEFVSGARGGSTERLAELDVEPPLLSVICRELNERRRALGQTQITADLVTGNRREILHDFYERSVVDLPEGMRRFVEDKLLTKSGFRDNLALETALEEPGVSKALIDTLVSRRLLRIEDRIGAQRVELTHDVLAEVIRASRDARQQRLELAAASRRTRRQRWVIAGLAIAVVGLLIGAVFGLRAQRDATKQAGQADLLLASRLLDEGKTSEGLAYLVSAGRKDPSSDVIAPRILTSLIFHNYALPVAAPLKLPAAGLFGAYTADGKRIFVQTEDDAVRVIDAVEWKLGADLTFGAKVVRGGLALARNSAAAFAAVLADGTLVVVNVATGQPRFPPIKPPGQIEKRFPTFGLCPDGHWLAAVGPDAVWVWDAETGKLHATLPSRSGFKSISFSPDSQRIAISDVTEARIYALPDGRVIGKPISAPNGVYGVAYAESVDRLAVWLRAPSAILLCDGSTGAPLLPPRQLPATSSVTGVQISPDGKRVLITTPENSVIATDIATGQASFLPLVHGGLVNEFGYSRDGKILFTNSVDGFFRLWDAETGTLITTPTIQHEFYTPIALAPDGRTVALFTTSGDAYRVRAGNGAARPLSLPRNASPTGATGSMVHVSSTAPARITWFTDKEVRAIDVASGREVAGGFSYPEPAMPGRSGVAPSGYGMTYRAGDKLMVRTGPELWHAWTFGDAGVVHDVPLVDVPSGVRDFRYESAANVAAASGISSDERNRIHIWDLRTGAKRTIIQTERPVYAPFTTFAPDEKRIAYRDADRTVHICDVATGKELVAVSLTGRAEITGLRFSPDGKRLLTGDTWGGVQVWDADDGKLLRSTQAHRDRVTRFDFSPDHRHYSSVSYAGSVQVWNSATDAPVGTPLLQSGVIVRADFSPDNLRILTTGLASGTRVWDVRSAQPLTPALQSEIGGGSGVVSFTHDGRYILALAGPGNGLGVVEMWPAPPQNKEPGTPEWLLRLATVCAGQRLDANRKLVSTLDEAFRFEEIRREVAALPDSQYAEWARWILSDDPSRSIAPGFTITPAEAKKLHDEYYRAATANAAPSANTLPAPKP